MAQTTRPCVTCGTTIHRTTAVGAIRAWCSDECRAQHRRSERHRVQPIITSVPCAGCQKPIERTGRAGKIQKYCSDDCKPRCAVADCDEPQSSRDWCTKHYDRWRQTGDPLTPVTRTSNKGLTCSVDGCDEPRRKREWCANHYAAWRNYGDPTVKHFEWAERTASCVLCGAPTARGLRRHCSQACWAVEARARSKGLDAPNSVISCQACGDPIDLTRRNGRSGGRSDTIACKPCLRQYRKHGASAKELAKEHGTSCGVCGEEVDLTLRYPDLMRGSIDHKVPVARGGTSDRSNLQLVHLRCNFRKGARYSQ